MKKILVDEKIVLRPLEKADSADIFRIIDFEREFMGRWLPFVKNTKQVEDTMAAMEFIISAENPTFAVLFGGKLVGLAGFKGADHANHRIEIGYWLSQKYNGHGIMTKSVSSLCCYAFEEMAMNRIQIRCAVGNTQSGNIPKRLGFAFESVERAGECYGDGAYFDLEVYSKLKKDIF